MRGYPQFVDSSNQTPAKVMLERMSKVGEQLTGVSYPLREHSPRSPGIELPTDLQVDMRLAAKPAPMTQGAVCVEVSP